MSRGFASSYRIVLLATGVFACFAGLGARLFYLQVTNRDELLRSVAKNRRHVITETARRGDILDAKGNLLATSRSLMVVGVDPRVLRPEDEEKWPQLAALLGLPLADLEKILTTKFRPPAPANSALAASTKPAAGLVLNLPTLNLTGSTAAAPAKDAGTALASGGARQDTEKGDDDVDLDEADSAGRREIRFAKLNDHVSESVYAAIEKLNVKGVYGTRIYRRAYPHGRLASHIIGYVNDAEEPATGIELLSDFHLRGQNGWRESEKDGRRRELAQFRTREVPRTDGYSVVLSLDYRIQDMVEVELDSLAKQLQPEKASIIVSDPRTGFILAMGNYPSFDLNEYRKVPAEAQASMKNIAITDVLEPGSTFKIVSVAAALDEGVITLADRFDCSLEHIEYRNRLLKLPKDDHHYDHLLSVAEIVARSSNRGAAQIGMKLGEQRLYDYARAFGFAQPLGFPTGGEVNGRLAKPAKWSGTDITVIPMGHTISATALQMHQAMSTIANNGVRLRPQIIREVRDAAGEVIYRYERAEVQRVVSEETAKTMARMLMAVASREGTAPEAAIPGYEVAGKTGTTQMLLPVVDSSGKRTLEYSDKHHIGSFVGFFPASNPEIAITVVVHDADGKLPGGWGAKVAAPSFKRLGDQLIRYRNIKPPPPSPANQTLLAMQGGRR
jgi:cell division protein FtsI (penicillin-binding protein 3)